MFLKNHDHTICLDTLKLQAIELCRQKKERLTPQRLEVLLGLARMHSARSAYELLAELQGDGPKLSPTHVYRALDFWHKLGFVHKIGSLDRFAVCFNIKDTHQHIVLCCRICYKVCELCDHRAGFDLAGSLKAQGFSVQSVHHVEIIAQCDQCTKAAKTLDKSPWPA